MLVQLYGDILISTVGCAVWALSTSSNLYFRGHITNCSNGKLQVTYTDTMQVPERSATHDIDDKKAIIVDTVPNPANVTVGTRVIGKWMMPTHFMPGYIKEVDETNHYYPRYSVHYDDTSDFWVNFDEVRLMPTKVNEGTAALM